MGKRTELAIDMAVSKRAAKSCHVCARVGEVNGVGQSRVDMQSALYVRRHEVLHTLQ